MRKLIVVLCVAALMLTLAVPALANPSISEEVLEVLTESTEVEAISEKEIDAVVGEFVTDPAKADTVKEVLTKVIGTAEGEYLLPEDVVKMLVEEEDKAEDLKKVAGYRFSTPFSKLSGKVDAVQFKDATKDTKFLWIGPNGELEVIEAGVDAAGNVVFTFPGEGLIAQIDLVA